MTYSVLIVDDDRELRTIYRVILERKGYTVYEAGNGVEALQFLNNQMPDVIVMDMLMPMMGGEAVMQRIRQMSSSSKVGSWLTAFRFREWRCFSPINSSTDQPDDFCRRLALCCRRIATPVPTTT
jgi:CheY-like chemotaxis protein